MSAMSNLALEAEELGIDWKHLPTDQVIEEVRILKLAEAQVADVSVTVEAWE
jgi:hypothetical protein